MTQTKVFITAYIPPELEQAWLQHVRNFDMDHKGCHFEVAMDAPDITLAEAVERLKVEPDLNFTQIYERKT